MKVLDFILKINKKIIYLFVLISILFSCNKIFKKEEKYLKFVFDSKDYSVDHLLSQNDFDIYNYFEKKEDLGYEYEINGLIDGGPNYCKFIFGKDLNCDLVQITGKENMSSEFDGKFILSTNKPGYIECKHQHSVTLNLISDDGDFVTGTFSGNVGIPDSKIIDGDRFYFCSKSVNLNAEFKLKSK
jgi:hypothetical protein